MEFLLKKANYKLKDTQLVLFWRAEFRKNNFLDLSLAYQYYSRNRTRFAKNLNTLSRIEVLEEGADQFNDFSNIFFRGVFSNDKVNSWLSYSSGIEANLDRLEGTRIKDQGQNIDDIGFFNSAEIKALDKLLIQPMIRFQYNSKYDAPVIPAVNLKYNILKNLDIKGSYSRGFRAPNIKELYLEFIDVSHNITGNPNLEAENSQHFNASLNYSFSTHGNIFKANIKAFRNEIQNEIFLFTDFDAQGGEDAVPPSTNINLGEFKTQGAEIGFNYFREELSVNFTAVAIGRFRSITGDFFYTPEANLNLIYYWEKLGLRSAILYKYTGRIENFQADASIDDNITADDIEPFIIEGFSNFDFTLTKEIKFGDLSFDISGGVKNLFDVTDLVTNGTGGGEVHGGGGSVAFSWGRTFFLSTKFNLKK
jgi:outer membrane receptor for ferrienterochelin and colicins